MCAQISANVNMPCVCMCVPGQLEICCWTTALDLLTNYRNSVQAGASACVSHSFNEFFSCSPPQPRSLVLQIHYFALTNQCV